LIFSSLFISLSNNISPLLVKKTNPVLKNSRFFIKENTSSIELIILSQVFIGIQKMDSTPQILKIIAFLISVALLLSGLISIELQGSKQSKIIQLLIVSIISAAIIGFIFLGY